MFDLLELFLRTKKRNSKLILYLISAYLNREIKIEQSVSMVVVQAAIPLAMYTSIGPELSVLTERQAIHHGQVSA